MLRRLAFAVTALCVAVCFLGPITMFVMDQLFTPFQQIGWNADGSNTGFYVQRDAKLLVRHRGFGPELDTDKIYVPWNYIPLFTVPPVLWFYAHRIPRERRDRRSGQFISFCAACPLLVTTLAVYLRRDDVLSVIILFVALIPLIIVGLVQLVNSRPSVAHRRIMNGLCHNCAYDLRATPKADGPRLPRCPECGATALTDGGPFPQPR